MLLKHSRDIKEIHEEYQQKIKDNRVRRKNWKRNCIRKSQANTLIHNINQAQLMLFDLRILNEKPETIDEGPGREIPKEKRPVTIIRKLATLYYKLKEFEKAKECYLDLLKHNPESAASYNGLSLVHMAQGNFVDAANAALDAIV
jgi:tetratricopeptide (TPR) repeat protein